MYRKVVELLVKSWLYTIGPDNSNCVLGESHSLWNYDTDLHVLPSYCTKKAVVCAMGYMYILPCVQLHASPSPQGLLKTREHYMK